MQARSLTSQANIMQQLSQHQTCASNTIPIHITSEERVSSQQEELNRIADQASNLGYGCGVALRKAIDNGKILCENLKKQFQRTGSGFFDAFFSSNKVYTIANQISSSISNAQFVGQCEQHVKEMEADLQKLPVCR